MRAHLTSLRGALVLLLVGTAILFAVGSTIERNHRTRHHEATTTTTEAGGSTSKTEGGGEASKPKSAETAHAEAAVRILGVDTESVVLSVIAVVGSLSLAAAVWFRPTRLVAVAVIGFGLVFAAGDGREFVHQLADANNGLAAVAALLLALHFLLATLAGALLRLPTSATGPPVAEAG